MVFKNPPWHVLPALRDFISGLAVPSELLVTFNLFRCHSCAKSWCCELQKNCAGSGVSGNLNPGEAAVRPELLNCFVPTFKAMEILPVPRWNEAVGEVVVTSQ